MKLKQLLWFAVLFMSSAFAQSAPPSATLTWIYADADATQWAVTGFAVERKVEVCTGTAAFAQIGTTAKAVKTYTDSTLVIGNTYCFRVAAINATGNSPYSNTASKAIPGQVPPAPTNLLITEVKVILNPVTGKWELQVKQYEQDPVTGVLSEAPRQYKTALQNQ